MDETKRAIEILEDACTDAKYYRTRYEYKETTLRMAKDEAEALAVLAGLARENAALKHIIDCANTPLMADVLKERDELKAQIADYVKHMAPYRED